MQSLRANWSSAPSRLILTGRPPAESYISMWSATGPIQLQPQGARASGQNAKRRRHGRLLTWLELRGSMNLRTMDGIAQGKLLHNATYVPYKPSYCAMWSTHYGWSDKYWFPGAIIYVRSIYGNCMRHTKTSGFAPPRREGLNFACPSKKKQHSYE